MAGMAGPSLKSSRKVFLFGSHLGMWFAAVVLFSAAAIENPHCEDSLLVQTRRQRTTYGSLARSLACELAERIRTDFKPPLEWFGPNPYVFNTTYTELTILCGERKEFQRPTWNWMVNYTPNPEDLKGSWHCPRDVEGYRKKDSAVDYYTSSLRWVSQKGFDFVVDTVASSVPILGGAITFLKKSFDWIWPTEKPPQSPCHGLVKDDWGKCVWHQILPFAKEFLDMEANKVFSTFYKETIEGYHDEINQTIQEAEGNSWKNGTFQPTPKVVKHMLHRLYNQVYDPMVKQTSYFRAESETAYAYFSQWASLHSTVIAALFSHRHYQDAGKRHNFQTTLGCYAIQIFNRSFHSIHNRLKGIYYLPHGYFGGNCVSEQSCPTGHGYERKECGTMIYMCRDNYTGSDGCQYLLDDIKGRDKVCSKFCDDVCQEFVGFHAYEMECSNRRNSTRDQTYEYWRYHLAPIPRWLEMIIWMDNKSDPENEPPVFGWGCEP